MSARSTVGSATQDRAIDRYLAEYDVGSAHSIEVDSDAATVYRAARELDLGRSVPIAVLMAIRGLPHFLTGKARPSRSLTLDTVLQLGFTILEERPPADLVLGAVGKFWRPDSGLIPVSREEFVPRLTVPHIRTCMYIKVRHPGSMHFDSGGFAMAAEITERIPAQQEQEWTPARIFLAVSAAYHLLLGAIGLAIDRTFPVGADATEHAGSEHIFGIFETNGWHSLAAVLLGLLSIFFVVRPQRARVAALLLGLSQLIVVISFAVVPPETFWFASNGADQWIHSLTAIGGIGAALLTRRQVG